MSLRVLTAAFVVAIAALGFMAWNRYSDRASDAPPAAGMPDAGAGGGMSGEVMPPPAGDPGIEWDAPRRWVSELASGMRLATYVIPGAGGGGDAQCAVYYFGPGQGGGVDPNIERWIGEFSTSGKPERRIETVSGMSVARVKVTGTYLSHSGPADGEAPQQQGWGLLGAIVNGPQGAVFFKLTGPEKTVARATAEFDGMMRSLRSK